MISLLESNFSNMLKILLFVVIFPFKAERFYVDFLREMKQMKKKTLQPCLIQTFPTHYFLICILFIYLFPHTFILVVFLSFPKVKN